MAQGSSGGSTRRRNAGKSAANGASKASNISNAKPAKADVSDRRAAKARQQQSGDYEQAEDESALLLREIKALDSGEEAAADFEILKNIDSDDEETAEAMEVAKDKNLARELKRFMATLGDFGKAAAAMGEESDSEAQKEAEDDDESSQDSTDEDKDAEESDIEEQSDVHIVPAAVVPQAETSASALARQKFIQSGLVVEPNPLWYEIPLQAMPPNASNHTLDKSSLHTIHARGLELLQSASEAFAGSIRSIDKKDRSPFTSTLSAADRTFISTILSSGTSSDKLSALILLSSSSPLHTTTYLSQLMSLAKKKSRDEAVRAVRAIVDWLKGGSDGIGSTAGLPNRKLRWFADQPGLAAVYAARQGCIKVNGQQLYDDRILVWAFEDWLKKWYFELLQVIETLAHDPLPFIRTQMTGFLSDLLASKPEQEQNILRLLVNKLGDSDRTVASRASFHILQLLNALPMTKEIVVKEVAGIVLRPPVAIVTAQDPKGKGKGRAADDSRTAASARSSEHGRYYGIITLNQIMLSREAVDAAVANRLIDVYFEVFNDLLDLHAGQTDEVAKDALPKDRKRRREEKKGRKLLAAPTILAASRRGRRQEERSQADQEAESKLLAAILTGVNRAFPYSDLDGDLLHDRADTLFRIVHTGSFNVGIQALSLVYQVSATQQTVSDRFYRTLYDTLIDQRLLSSSKQAMYLNLLFKAIRSDISTKRVAAFVKRLMQILSHHLPPFICGSLYLLGELFKLTPGLSRMLSDTEQHDDDDIEVFRDAPDGYTADSKFPESSKESSTNARSTTNGVNNSAKYDGRLRNPQYANAISSCLWEVVPLLQHFHPSVALHATQLLTSSIITTKPDLELHTISHFLDRFVYRNAKSKSTGQGSLNKPGAAGQDRSGKVLMRKGAMSHAEAEMNSARLLKQKPADVPADQLFFHKFFLAKDIDAKAEAAKAKPRRSGDAHEQDDYGGAGSDAADTSAESAYGAEEDSEEEETVLEADAADVAESELDEEEVWQAIKQSRPNLEDSDSASEGGDESDISDSAFAYDNSDNEGGVAVDTAASDTDPDLRIDEEVGEALMNAISGGQSEVSVDEQGGSDIEQPLSEGEGDSSDGPADDDEDQQEQQDLDDLSSGDEDDLAAFLEEEDAVHGSDDDIDLDDNFTIPVPVAGRSNARRMKKRKLKHLPAFADADDWAKLIDDGKDANI